MKSLRFLGLSLVLALAPAAAFADDAAFFKERLGDAYAEASPVDKIVMLSVAKADKKFKDYKERKRVQAEVDAIVLAEVKKGKDSTEKLAILGKIRKDGTALVKELTTARRKEKKSYVSFSEPSSGMQGALAMSFVADVAGPAPSIDKLACLKQVRESTSWTSHRLAGPGLRHRRPGSRRGLREGQPRGQARHHQEDRGRHAGPQRPGAEVPRPLGPGRLDLDRAQGRQVPW